MNEELIGHRVEVCEARINNHSGRIDRLEVYQGQTNVKLDNICISIASQTKALWWLIGLLGTSLVGFFFYVIQSSIL